MDEELPQSKLEKKILIAPHHITTYEEGYPSISRAIPHDGILFRTPIMTKS
jgi:hypothetical protein